MSISRSQIIKSFMIMWRSIIRVTLRHGSPQCSILQCTLQWLHLCLTWKIKVQLLITCTQAVMIISTPRNNHKITATERVKVYSKLKVKFLKSIIMMTTHIAPLCHTHLGITNQWNTPSPCTWNILLLLHRVSHIWCLLLHGILSDKWYHLSGIIPHITMACSVRILYLRNCNQRCTS